MTNEQWQNSSITVGLVYVSAGIMMLLGMLLCLAAIGTMIPFQFGNLGQVLMLALAGFGTISGGFGVWKMGLRAARNRAQLQADGVHFFYGSKETDVIRWSDIKRVTKKGGTVLIHGGDGQLLGFDGYAFFFPSRLGKAIAGRAGQELLAE